MSGVFFRGLAAAAGAARPSADHILIEQLLAAAGNGVRVQAEEIAEQGVAAMTQADGLQAGKQAALLFVEQAIEQQDGGLEFIGGNLEGDRMNRQRHCLSAAASQDLFATIGRIDGGVEKLAIDFGSAQTPLRHQMAERLLNLGMQDIGQFMGVIAVGGARTKASTVANSVP